MSSRKSPRAVRFAKLRVGDELMKDVVVVWKNPDGSEKRIVTRSYYECTDRWHDPVAGQEDPVAGEMVGIVQLIMKPDSGAHGKIRSSKRAHTLRGLASQGFHYSDRDLKAQMRKAIRNSNELDLAHPTGVEPAKAGVTSQ